MPNVLTMDINSATSVLGGVGLSVGQLSSVNNCIDPGTVQSQNPSAGTLVDPGSAVSISVCQCTGTGGGGGSGGGDDGGNPRQPK